jgi:hypothetical protein
MRAAQTMAARGDIAMAGLNYLEAAERFKNAITRLPDGHPAEAVRFLDRKADALLREGEEHDDSTALLNAAASYRLALEKEERGSDPAAWAATQGNLAAALRILAAYRVARQSG